MEPYLQSLVDYYNQKDLIDNILRALERAGRDIRNLTREDIARLDEFHIRGLRVRDELYLQCQAPRCGGHGRR